MYFYDVRNILTLFHHRQIFYTVVKLCANILKLLQNLLGSLQEPFVHCGVRVDSGGNLVCR